MFPGHHLRRFSISASTIVACLIYVAFLQVFPKGSPLVADVSRAILKVTEGDEIVGIERKWLGQDDEVSCNSLTNASGPGSSVVTWSNLQGVFYISMGLLVAAGIVYAAMKYLPCGQGRRQQGNNDNNGIEEGRGGQQVVEPADQNVIHDDSRLPLRRNRLRKVHSLP